MLRIIVCLTALVTNALATKAVAEFATLRFDGDQCLYDGWVWDVCTATGRDSMTIFEKPASKSGPVQLKTTTGKCLGVISTREIWSDRTEEYEEPAIGYFPCNAGDKRQLWQLNYGPKKNNIRSLGGIGLCSCGEIPGCVYDGYIVLSCPESKSGPTCIGFEDGNLGINRCQDDSVTLVDVKSQPRPTSVATGTSQNSTVIQEFNTVLNSTKFPQISNYSVGFIYADSSDVEFLFVEDSIKKMIDICLKKCLSVKCVEFDVHVPPDPDYYSTCSLFLTTVGKATIPDPDSAAFYVKY